MARKALITVTLLAWMVGVAHCQEPIWRSYVETEGRAGNSRDLGQGRLFLPLWQDGSQLLFADVRGHWTDAQTAEGNLGLAYRRILPSECILGLYSFYDLRHIRQTGARQQVTVGVELLNEEWGFRVNGYIPDRRVKTIPALNTAFILGNNIVVRRGEERAYYGMEFEVERLLWGTYGGGDGGWLFSHLDAEIWAAGGMFHFDNDTPDFNNMTGPRARVELRLYDLPLLGDDSRLVAGGQYEYDEVRGGVGSGMLTVRIPFGRRTRSGPRLSPLDRRMVTPIVRDIDIVTVAGLGVPEPAKFARTGAVISNAVIVDANTANAETAIQDAGTNSVAIADGSAGVIMTPGTIDLNPGQLLMGGGSQLAVFGCNTGAAAIFAAPGTRGTIDSGANVNINGANNSCIQSVDLLTSGMNAHAIVLNNTTNVLIQDAGIGTSGDNANGILAFGNSQFDVNGSFIGTGGTDADAILSFDNSQYNVNGSTLATIGDDANGITSADGSLFNVNNSFIFTEGVDADGVLSFGNSAYTVTNSLIGTSGNFADGITSIGDSLFNVINSTIATTGDEANGIHSFDASQYIVSGSLIDTSGDFAHGILSFANSRYDVLNSFIDTEGFFAHGIFAGENSRFFVDDSSITTTGNQSRGVFAFSSATNTITFLLNSVAINSADDGVFLDGEFNSAGTINATIQFSEITAGAGLGIHEIDAASDGTSVICLDAFGNTLDIDFGSINLNTVTSGTINVTQLAPTPAFNFNELDDANFIFDTQVFQMGGGTITFDAGFCPTP